MIIKVPSWLHWVETGVKLEQGQEVSCLADGEWWDAIIRCTANGYAAPLFYAAHVYPRIRDEGRYFRLMGRIAPGPSPPMKEDPAQTFVIGTGARLRAPRDGYLFVFANDNKYAYWNNLGSIRLTIDV